MLINRSRTYVFVWGVLISSVLFGTQAQAGQADCNAIKETPFEKSDAVIIGKIQKTVPVLSHPDQPHDSRYNIYIGGIADVELLEALKLKDDHKPLKVWTSYPDLETGAIYLLMLTEVDPKDWHSGTGEYHYRKTHCATILKVAIPEPVLPK